MMLLGQHLVYELLRQGYTGISSMAEFTAKLVEDHTADFIINNGGWVSTAKHLLSLRLFISVLSHSFLVYILKGGLKRHL